MTFTKCIVGYQEGNKKFYVKEWYSPHPLEERHQIEKELEKGKYPHYELQEAICRLGLHHLLFSIVWSDAKDYIDEEDASLSYSGYTESWYPEEEYRCSKCFCYYGPSDTQSHVKTCIECGSPIVLMEM